MVESNKNHHSSTLDTHAQLEQYYTKALYPRVFKQVNPSPFDTDDLGIEPLLLYVIIMSLWNKSEGFGGILVSGISVWWFLVLYEV